MGDFFGYKEDDLLSTALAAPAQPTTMLRSGETAPPAGVSSSLHPRDIEHMRPYQILEAAQNSLVVSRDLRHNSPAPIRHMPRGLNLALNKSIGQELALPRSLSWFQSQVKTCINVPFWGAQLLLLTRTWILWLLTSDATSIS